MSLPVLRFNSIRVTDVLGLVVQPAVRFHCIFIGDLGRSILIPEREIQNQKKKKEILQFYVLLLCSFIYLILSFMLRHNIAAPGQKFRLVVVV